MKKSKCWLGKLASASSSRDEWEAINWQKAESGVKQLQMRIAKAIKEGKRGKVKALQRLLTCSFYARLLAVKRITSNSGKNTPGIDGIIWETSPQKMQAARTLKRKGYQPSPLRRVYIPKKNGKKRPLGIPTLRDRAQQALHLLALEPIAETTADKNSYGFRPHRNCADAIEQCFGVLARKHSAQWILEGDIKSCFDKISHRWLENKIPMDRKMLHLWLKSGYLEKEVFHPTREGTMQGGTISPTLANMTLDGLEQLLLRQYRKGSWNNQKVNMVRYADDFVITGNTKQILENEVKPMVESFLRERGLELSLEKTKITHIEDGFDFLGFNIRKFSGKLLTKPAKKNVFDFLRNITTLIKHHKAVTTEVLIRKLNARIRGWANYYRHAVSSDTFSYIDSRIFQAIYKWVERRHPNKNAKWWRNKYFRTHKQRQWIFSVKVKDKKGVWKHLDLFHATKVKIKRHIKIRAEANPYDPEYKDYFKQRNKRFKINQYATGSSVANLPIF